MQPDTPFWRFIFFANLFFFAYHGASLIAGTATNRPWITFTVVINAMACALYLKAKEHS